MLFTFGIFFLPRLWALSCEFGDLRSTELKKKKHDSLCIAGYILREPKEVGGKKDE